MDVPYCPGGYPVDIHFCPSDIHWRSYGYPSETLLDVQWISIPDIHRMYRNVRWICNGYPLKEIWISTYWNMDIHWTFNSINQHKHCAPTHPRTVTAFSICFYCTVPYVHLLDNASLIGEMIIEKNVAVRMCGRRVLVGNIYAKVPLPSSYIFLRITIQMDITNMHAP